MQKLTWSTSQKSVDELVPQKINPRTISEKQLKDLTKSLEKFNLVEIPAVDKDGTILAGHQRIKVLKILGRGKELIDIRVPNRKLTKKEREEYLIASNALGGDWDFSLLEENFEFDQVLSFGFDEEELSNNWLHEVDIDSEQEEGEELQKPKEVYVKTGDLIKLGKHRILCADSTKKDNLKRLFGMKKASMIYSDPVYNISVDYNRGIGGDKSYGGSVHDTRNFDEYKQFIKDSLLAGLSVSKKDTHVFYWCDQNYIGVIQDVYRSAKIAPKRVAIWLKNGHTPVPNSIMNKMYEPCVYGSRGEPYLNPKITNLNEVMNKEMSVGNELFEKAEEMISDVWTAKRLPVTEYEHATTKPLNLHEKAIKRCTKPGDIILDSFLGSGSTLLSADQLDRVVYGLELEPEFCQLIINRYGKQTGNKAVIEHDEA